MMCSAVFNAINLLLNGSFGSSGSFDEFDLADVQNFILSKLKDPNSYPENKENDLSEAIMILIGTLQPSEMILIFNKVSEIISQLLKNKYLSICVPAYEPLRGSRVSSAPTEPYGFPMPQMPPMALQGTGVQQMPTLPMSAFPQIPQPGFSIIGNPQMASAFSLPTVSGLPQMACPMQPMESPNPFLGLPTQPMLGLSPQSSQDELPENDNEDSFPEPRRTKKELDTELDHLAADRKKHYTATNAKQACDCDQCDADRLANQWHRHCIHNKPRESNIKKLEAEKLEAEKNERAKRFGQHICCPQCGSTQLALREVPARAADETSSFLFRCNRCGTNGRKD